MSDQETIVSLRGTIEAIEWAGGKHYGAYGPVMPCCPACKGIRADITQIGPPRLGHTHGHRHGCPVAVVLARETSPDREIPDEDEED